MDTQGPYQLETQIVGSLPIVNHFIDRLHLDELLAQKLATANAQTIDPAQSIGVVLRNIILRRVPVYSLGEWASQYIPELLGLVPDQLPSLNDDRFGRALDVMFDADRASLLTEVVVRAIKEFDLDLSQIHNDSTSITFFGIYENATGNMKRGKRSLKITKGHNKDHRPDLKQLMWLLTVTADGAVPIHYRVCDGNVVDSPTHIETWDAIKELVGRSGFIYVADSKLCTAKNMKYIDTNNGKFITVLPRNRKEDKWFREYVQSHNIPWELVRELKDENDDSQVATWSMFESPIRSSEGFRIVWVWDSQKEERDSQSRQAFIEKAIWNLELLETRLNKPRTRLRARNSVIEEADKAIGEIARRWLEYSITEEKDTKYRQEKRGRPGPETKYKRVAKTRFHVTWSPRDENIAYDARSDGMFPLITNCDDLSLKVILDKYKFQPRLEKRHEQLKSEYAVAPVFLKKETRIEGLLFVYFLALLIQSLIEREVRGNMKLHEVKSLPIYPEDRSCEAPTTPRLLSMFENVEFHQLMSEDAVVQTFRTELSVKQKEVLTAAGVPIEKYL
jgi:transposase